MTDSQPSIGTVGTSFEIIEGLNELGEAGITELAQYLDKSKSSVYKHLNSLLELGYVTKQDGRYKLGLAFFRLGYGIREANRLYKAASAPLDNLAQTTGETVSLIVEEHGDAVCLYQASSRPEGIRTIRESERVPPDSITAGKAILSGRSTSEAIQLLDRQHQDGQQAYSELCSELGSIHERQVLIERSPDESDCNAVATPIYDGDDYAIGAIMVYGSPTNMAGKHLEEDIPGLLISTAKTIEVELATR
ncbi:IclR family transcriptional regulator [Halosolutus gelatinilyticus]|uniref:IclR family transcriptional regulator n=1 Tax=Halosolutus gelatinilyticus TaxID=2931975 RepID=UPI001FF3257F|nr:helix-turn-helix domain-containing protein [Halosolutus gelatinilyticus]